MPYTKTTWANGGTPAINETKLNNIEEALDSLRKIPTAGGTATAITFNDYKFTLTDGCVTGFVCATSNTAAATTAAINGGAAKSVYKPGGTNAPNFVAGKAYSLWYSSDDDCFFLKASAVGDAVASEVLAGKRFSNDDETDILATGTDVRRWANGTYSGASGTISGLSFQPKLVFIRIRGDSGSYHEWGAYYFDSINSDYGGARVLDGGGNTDIYTSSGNVTINADGFTFGSFGGFCIQSIDWWAFE